MTRSVATGLALAAAMLAPASAGQAAEDNRAARAVERAAASEAGRAERALRRHRPDEAVALAEQAVMRMPRSATYRMLLGRAYLEAGRFVAAAGSFGDVLAIAPDHDAAGLKLVLAQIATGDRAAALATLSAQGTRIGAADRGLALALAGEPAAAVALLLDAAREAGAAPRVRQNLALAYALAGEWPSARVVAATDLPPAEVDRRLQQWAGFVQARRPADQVAALLGVTAVADPGQPAVLALAPPAGPVAAVAAVSAPPVVPTLARVVAPVAPAAIRFAARQEVVQPLPAAVEARRWHVQLGAFPDMATAHAAWDRFARREPTVAAGTAQGSEVRVRDATLIRLSVGGLAYRDADRLCRRHRSRGGRCFVRAAAGDHVLAWDGAGTVGG